MKAMTFSPEFRVDTRERFIQEEKLGFGEQRPTDRDPPALAPGEVAGKAAQERSQIEQLDDLIEVRRQATFAAAPYPVAQIAADVEMRKQPPVLEHVAKSAPFRGQVDAGGGIEEDPPGHGDAAVVRPLEAGDHIQSDGFPGPGAGRIGR